MQSEFCAPELKLFLFGNSSYDATPEGGVLRNRWCEGKGQDVGGKKKETCSEMVQELKKAGKENRASGGKTIWGRQEQTEKRPRQAYRGMKGGGECWVTECGGRCEALKRTPPGI